jgi:pimeloyl-ACP methyl ester carboxylesterase/DNA-binding CsgD family transcriptional regulator
MRPAVRFLTTGSAGGGRVAYSVAGSGPPLVYLSGWVSHLGLGWDTPSHRRFVGALARDHTVIRYDKLGCGLSDRSRTDFTLASELDVLAALIGHLGLRTYSLLGCCDGGQVAAAHAAANPDPVSSLVVYGSCARGADLASAPVQESLLSLVRAHWGLGSRVLADIWYPDAPPETTNAFARLQRNAATAEMAASLLAMFYSFDVDALLPSIRVPTLVLHRRGSRAVPFELGRQLAARIPNAQLSALDGRMQPIDAEREDEVAAAIGAFRGSLSHRPPSPSDRSSSDPTDSSPSDLTDRPVSVLTDREQQVVDLIVDGSTNPDIARALGVSVRTVDAHVEHVRRKLGLRARTQIAVWGSRRRR